MRRRIHKLLVCPACGVVIADATYTRWPGNLRLVAPDGSELMPESVGSLMRRAQTEVRADFLRRHVGELVFDLRCRNGHQLLRTMPQLVRAVRDAGGMWADPA